MANKTNHPGKKTEKPWRDALMRAVKRSAYGTGNPRQLEVIADAVVSKAAEGDVLAAREVGDRLDGKPVQGLALEVGVHITRIERTIIDPRVIDVAFEDVTPPNGADADPVVRDGQPHAIRKLSDRR